MEKRPLSPRINGHYKDTEGRTLRVTQINPIDPKDREVVGKVTSPSGQTRDYSTTIRIFSEVWTKEVL